jgi:hypothetical protein
MLLKLREYYSFLPHMPIQYYLLLFYAFNHITFSFIADISILVRCQWNQYLKVPIWSNDCILISRHFFPCLRDININSTPYFIVLIIFILDLYFFALSYCTCLRCWSLNNLWIEDHFRNDIWLHLVFWVELNISWLARPIVLTKELCIVRESPEILSNSLALTW